MHYYNGLDAAKRIGISYKTLLRWIEKDKIVPEQKTSTGQLMIAEEQVEHLRMQVQQERDMFRHSQAVIPKPGHHQTGTDRETLPLTDTTLAETVKQLGKLTARIDVQAARIEELERRISEVERLSQTSIDSPSQSQTEFSLSPETSQELYRFVTDRLGTKAQHQPQNRNVVRNQGIPDGLLDGTLHAYDFATQLGVSKSVMEGWLKNGVRGEQLDRIKIPTAREGRYTSYFTPAQQQHAIEVLRRYDKI